MQNNTLESTNVSATSKMAYWRSIIEEWKQSGLTKPEFCEQFSHNIHTFSYWQSKCSPRKKNDKSRFAKVDLVTSHAGSSYEPIIIELPSGIKLKIPNSFDPQNLISLLKILGA